MNKRGKRFIASSEILILIVATFAFAYLISSVGVVSGADVGDVATTTQQAAATGGAVKTIYDFLPAWLKPSNTPNPVPSGTGEKAAQLLAPRATDLNKEYSATKTFRKPIILNNQKISSVGEKLVDGQTRYFSNINGVDTDITDDLNANNLLDNGKIKSSALNRASQGKGLWGGIGDVYEYGGGEGALSNAGAMDSLVSSAAWGITAGGIAYGAAYFLTDNQATRNAAGAAIGAGFFVGRLANTMFGVGGLGSFLIGGAVAIAIFLLMNKKEKTEIVRFECLPWDSQARGEKCDECNKQGILPCSEYQCRSLGQGCEIVNAGTEDEECVWINRKDVDSPEVRPWEGALLPDYNYEPDNTKNPPDRGTFIKSSQTESKCIKAFTPFSFGVTVNEPAKCKLDYLDSEGVGGRKPFEDMRFYFGGSSLLLRNHTQTLSLPGPGATEEGELNINNNEEYELYVACEDANGNPNEGEFVFQFCVDKGPDTTPPLIVNTNLLNNMPVAFNTTSVNISLYVNEPADCRWSRLDQDYPEMENQMSCSNNVFEMNAQMLYRCSSILTGIRNREENIYYFRCLDLPGKPIEDRNPNTQSHEFTIMGTQPLVIDGVSPNGTIRDSTNVVEVNLEAATSAGFNEGASNCYFSTTGDDDDYTLFNTDRNYDSHEHSQPLFLPEGDYQYFVKCVDLGGNTDTDEISFTVESDNEAPIITRIYHDSENHLRILTNEPAECVYSRDTCNYLFADGTRLTISGENDDQHYVEWNVNINYFIKCMDEFGNQPLPNACSIVARPFANVVNSG